MPTKVGRAFEPVPGPIAAQLPKEKVNGHFLASITIPRKVVPPAKDSKHAPIKKTRTSPEFNKVGFDRRGSPRAKGYSPSNAMPRKSPPNGLYAGPRFSEPPSPTALPKPPLHWTDCAPAKPLQKEQQPEVCVELTNRLKVLLKVQA
ncbi:proline-rich nuclear receptor coactivator 2-like [Ornithodoros turicata]